MKGIIFCSIFLLWTITVLNSKSYLVEVDDNDQGNSNQDTTETPADQEEGIDEAADEVDVEDINDDDDEETDRLARKLEGTDDETEGKLVLLYHL